MWSGPWARRHQLMPKKRKQTRKGADTLRVPSLPPPTDGGHLGSLEIVQGADADLGRHVLCDHPITIGRDDGIELTLSDGSISRRHCRVERHPATNQYMIVDLGSTNGTLLNGQKVDGQFPLTAGDKIFLGGSVLRFNYSDVLDIQYQSQMAKMVTTDPLTGLGSRRQHDAIAPLLAERAEAERALLSVMVMDMDGLKKINDTHGHEMGGFAIVEVSHLIRAVLDDYGVLYRYGGDEFVGYFMNMDQLRATELAEQVRQRVCAHNFVSDGIRLEPTISIGIATYPNDSQSAAALFKLADRALYKAKQSGRNRVSTPSAD